GAPADKIYQIASTVPGDDLPSPEDHSDAPASEEAGWRAAGCLLARSQRAARSDAAGLQDGFHCSAFRSGEADRFDSDCLAFRSGAAARFGEAARSGS